MSKKPSPIKQLLKDDEIGHYISLLLRIGATMMLSIGIFFGIGLLLFTSFELSSVVLIGFTLGGVGVGFYLTYRLLKLFM